MMPPKLADVIAFGVRMVWPDCQVTIATDGARALVGFAADPPDLVVLDVSMPAPDGFEVCRRIRTTSHVPILMLTVHDATLDSDALLDDGTLSLVYHGADTIYPFAIIYQYSPPFIRYD